MATRAWSRCPTTEMRDPAHTTLGLQPGRDGRVLSIELFERPARISKNTNKIGSKYFPIFLAHTQPLAYSVGR